MKTVDKGDIVEFNGKRFVAMLFDSGNWLFSPAVKSGNRPDHRKELQRLPLAQCKKVGAYKAPEITKEFLPATDATDATEQINRMVVSMETYTKHKIKCFVCMENDSARDLTDVRFAR